MSKEDSPRPDAANHLSGQDLSHLPDDPVVLKQMIAELLSTLHERDRDVDALRHRLDQLLRRLYGPRAERYDPNQPVLFPEADTESCEASVPLSEPKAETPAKSSSQGGHGRKSLPTNLPRQRVVHDIPEGERCCSNCGEKRVVFGEETSEQLDFKPTSLFIIEHVRLKYACRKCQGNVTTAEKPPQPIAKGLAGAGLLAQVIVSKYGDHLPLGRQTVHLAQRHRLERIFSRYDMELSRQTMCDWMADCGKLLGPLYDLMREQVLQSRVVHTDDTPVPMQDKSKGCMWVYLGDIDHPYNVYDFTPSRSRHGPVRFLQGYAGYLQADAFSGYDCIYGGVTGERVVEVACWAQKLAVRRQ